MTFLYHFIDFFLYIAGRYYSVMLFAGFCAVALIYTAGKLLFLGGDRHD